jgi:hypothetical protein
MRRCVDHLDSPPTQECQYCKVVCTLQAEEVVEALSGAEGSGDTNVTNVEFLDETPGTTWSLSTFDRTNLNDRQPEVELARYLNRPVLIKSHIWAQTDNYSTTTSWYPWHLFFNSTPIKNKITNYTYLNCKLKLKFVVNASPFYSGAMAFTYCPLQDINGNSLIADTGAGELMGYSQRPKVWVYPQTCQGGEIELPFFYHKNWLNITSAADVKSMGTITPALYAQLVSATGITGTSIVVNVYAWAEDVKLHAPTISAALQADEYDSKPSQIATSIANSTMALRRIPVIGPYMMATSVVSSSFSKVASAMGFTNVSNIDKVSTFKPNPFPHNSTCEISVPTERSGVDPKNEVTIDPRTVGLDGKDELSIFNIAGRESFLGTAILSSSDVIDSLTLTARVTPALIYQVGANTPRQYTPMGYLCEMFKYWRGDIIFRFKFICTRFHKGRVRISYDPSGDISTTVPDYTTIFNEVVDIGAEQDVEVRVPYMQATTYLRTALTTGNYNFAGTALAPSSACNGLITMRVVNPLSGPVATTAIPVQIFVRAADNIEFAWPTLTTTGTTSLSPYTLQSEDMVYPVEPKQIIAGNSINLGDPQRNLIHYGEHIASLRPLIHRLTYQYTVVPADIATTNTLTIQTCASSRRIKYAGFDSNGVWTANQVIGASTANYNFMKMNVQQLVSLLFIGQRGSMTWSYNIENTSNNPPANVSLKRYDNTITAADYKVTQFATNPTSTNVISRAYNIYTHDFNNGVALTDQRNQPSIAMNFPYYSQYNFQLINPNNATLGSGNDGTDLDNVSLQIFTQKLSVLGTTRVNVWGACGPDYNFFFFINAPSLYTYTIPTGT